MPRKKTIAHILRDNFGFLKEHYGVKKIGLFGSAVKGRLKKNSDVDILIEFSRPVGFKYLQLAGHIENILGRKVDIITPAGIRSIRIKEVAADILRNIVYV